MSRNAENVVSRTNHAWSQFANHPELGFIDVTWLERYREKRKQIINRRIEDTTAAGETLHKDRLGEEEETILNKDTIRHLQALMRKHRSWHPFKFPSTMLPLNDDLPSTSRLVWLRQAKEMHDKCKEFKEGYAWEYFWNNWYKWDKWQLWARAACIDYYPIIQTNAPVETHWNSIKNRVLLYFNRIRLDHLCSEIHQNFLPVLATRIGQYRKGTKDTSWHAKMVSEWKSLERKIAQDNEADLAEIEQEGIDPESQDSPIVQRERRMIEQHCTDIFEWNCRCAAFNYSPYHICSHLIRIYGKAYPLRGESFRQHAPPLLWVEGLHDEQQRFQRPPPVDQRRNEPPASLEQLGIRREDLVAMAEDIQGSDDDDDQDYSRIETERREYERWLEGIEAACKYAREELGRSRERFRRLPKPSLRCVGTLMKLAQNAHVLDRSRRRRTTYGPERAGSNLYRN